MATGIMILPIGASLPTDGSSGWPAISILTSSDADTPKARCFIAGFDATTAESLCFGGNLPANFVSGCTIRGNLYFGGAQDSKYCVMRAAAIVVSPGDAIDVMGLDPVNIGTGWQSTTVAVAGTAGYVDTFEITLTLSGAAAGDVFFLIFGRNPADGSDDAGGDANVMNELHLEFETA